MITKYIFAVLSGLFLIMGVGRLGSNRIQARTWIWIGIIFGLVSAWLFYNGI